MDLNSLDSNGFPVILLADTPNSGGVVARKSGRQGGNEQHDSASGKFAPGSSQGDPEPNVPANTDAQAYFRMLDAVRDLAREMDDMEAGDVQEFLAGRLKRPLTPEELNQFIMQVRQQRVNDLIDVLDYQFRSLIDNVKRGRRKVRVAAPKGWIRKTFNSLTDDEILSVVNRLEARGHKRSDLQTSVIGKIRKQSRAQDVGSRLADIPENDTDLELSLSDFEDIEPFEEFETVEHNFAQVIESINKQAEQPIVVNVNVEGKGRRIVNRDKAGNITSIDET